MSSTQSVSEDFTSGDNRGTEKHVGGPFGVVFFSYHLRSVCKKNVAFLPSRLGKIWTKNRFRKVSIPTTN